MTTTQYVGARYVPIFAEPAEWNNTRNYEPLTIVTHEGNSYTSRQYVPKGIDISNDDFWALTGNYNAQVEAYRKEVIGYSERVDNSVIAFATMNDVDESILVDNQVVFVESRNGNYGSGYWKVGTSTANDYNVVSIGSKTLSLIADDEVSIEQLGCPANGNATEFLKFALNNYSTVYVEGINYTLNEQINLGFGKHLIGKYLDHIGYYKDDSTFIWIGEHDNAAIAMFGRPKSQFYDDYSGYGMVIENISVNGNNNLAMGFIVTGQQTSYVSMLCAFNCTVGIVFTRMWNANVGHCAAFHCELGISTWPALSLKNGIPVVPSGVDDTAVNNVNFSNLTAQDCVNGIFIGVSLAALFDVIDVERCTGKYGLYLRSCNSLINTGHFEDLSTASDEYVAVYISEQYRDREPSFNYLLCNSIYCEDTCHIEHLGGYAKNTVFSGKTRPIVSNYTMFTKTNVLDSEHSPLFNPVQFIKPNEATQVPCVQSLAIALFNNGTKEGSGTISVVSDDGKAITTIDVPTVPYHGTTILIFHPLYSVTLGGLCNINFTGAPSEYRAFVIGNVVN